MTRESKQRVRLSAVAPVEWTDEVHAQVDLELEWRNYKRAGRIMSYAVIEAAFDVVFERQEEEYPQQVRRYLAEALCYRWSFDKAWEGAMREIPRPAGWSRKKEGARAYRNLERPTSPLEFLEDCMHKAYNEVLERQHDEAV